MSAARAAIWLLAAACYRPSPPTGVPCSPSGECPGGEVCVEGVCGGDGEPTPDVPAEHVVVIGDRDVEVSDAELWGIPEEIDRTHDDDHFSVDDRELGLVRFDLELAPPNTRVTRALLTLHTFDDASEDGGTVTIHRMRQGWVQEETTWNLARAGEPWRLPGAGAPESRDAEVLATLQPNRLGAAFEVELPVDVAQAWLDDPSQNFGIAVLRGTSVEHVHFVATNNTLPSSTLTLHLVPKP